MKGIKTLIRLRKQQLDEKRKLLAEQENEKLRLEQALSALQQELKKEQKLAAESPDIAFMLVRYAEENKQKQKRISEAIDQKNLDISQFEKELHILFSELKKYDIALEQMLAREAQEAKRKETIMLDDIAQENFRNHKDNE